MTIPARLHFCWIGPSLPWAYVFAVLSAAERGALDEVVLHHTGPLNDGDALRALRRAPGVRLSRCDPLACMAEAGHHLGLGGDLARLYRALDAPVMRADVLRAAILYLHGGLYLDLDTVTVRPLRPLTATQQFASRERIVWPQAVRRSRSPLLLARHGALDLARKALRRAPEGWRAFRRIERLYPLSANNAAMGAARHADLPARLLRAMAAQPPGFERHRTALGPALLQQVLAAPGAEPTILHEPAVFHPLPPEISEHWFRTVRTLRLDDVLSAETRAVHWYASVRTRDLVARITPAFIEENRDRQLYSALVARCVGSLAGMGGPRAAAG